MTSLNPREIITVLKKMSVTALSFSHLVILG
jgi:hypothetical protein